MTLKMSKDGSCDGNANDIKTRIDPVELLDSLSSLLGPQGQILGMEEAADTANKMQDTPKLVSRCTYVNILKATKDESVLTKFMESGGWEVLNKWLNEGKDDENKEFLQDLLTVYSMLPVSVETLKQNNCAKTIKQISKTAEGELKDQANKLVNRWMAVIKAGQASDKDKDKEKDKEKVKDKEKEKDKKKRHSDHKSSRSDRDREKSSSSSKHRDRDEKSHRSSSDRKDRDKDRDKDKPKSKSEVKSEPSSKSPSHKSSPDREIKSEKSSDSKSDKSRSASSVKIRPGKYRATGLEQEQKLPVIKKKPSDDVKPLKRNSLSKSPSGPPEKKPKTSPPPSPSTSVMTSIMNSMSTTTTERAGGVKLIAPPAKRPDIYESSGFMDAMMQTPSSTIVRKRRRSTTDTAKSKDNGKAEPTSPTPTSPPAKQPAVPSFYKDTMETSDTPAEEEVKKENGDDVKEEESYKSKLRSASPMEVNGSSSDAKESGSDAAAVDAPSAAVAAETEGSKSPASQADADAKSDISSSNQSEVSVKTKKKSVRWAPDANLKEFFYFELDENERVNVNKKFADIRKEEQARERALLAGRSHQEIAGDTPWRRPPRIDGLENLVDRGMNSKQRDIQARREQSVLVSLYFSKDMIPDTAKEPDHEEPVEPEEPQVMPLEDVSGQGGEIVHEGYPDPVEGMPVNVRGGSSSSRGGGSHQPQPLMEQPHMHEVQPVPQQQMASNGAGGFSLPPDVAALLATMAAQGEDSGASAQMQELQQQAAGLSSLMNEHQLHQLFHNIMGQDPSMDDPLTSQLRQALEPFKEQFAMMDKQMVNQNMSNNGLMPQPMGGPRGLLGNGPGGPGMMGPMMGGPMGGPGFMGPRFMGPGPDFDFGPRGPPRGRGGRGRGGFRGGGRFNGNQDVCRYFAKTGNCRYGNDCRFLHPGLNGPRL